MKSFASAYPPIAYRTLVGSKRRFSQWLIVRSLPDRVTRTHSHSSYSRCRFEHARPSIKCETCDSRCHWCLAEIGTVKALSDRSDPRSSFARPRHRVNYTRDTRRRRNTVGVRRTNKRFFFFPFFPSVPPTLISPRMDCKSREQLIKTLNRACTTRTLIFFKY